MSEIRKICPTVNSVVVRMQILMNVMSASLRYEGEGGPRSLDASYVVGDRSKFRPGSAPLALPGTSKLTN